MAVSTHSTYDLIEIFQEAIEVPEEHVADRRDEPILTIPVGR